MFELFRFFFSRQVKTIATIFSVGILTVMLVSFISVPLAKLAFILPLFYLSFTWPKTFMAPMLNFHWLATLPVSRVELAVIRVCLLFSGTFLAGLGGSAHFFLSMKFLISPERVPQALAVDASAAAGAQAATVSQESNSFAFHQIFGGDMVLIATFLLVLVGFLVLISSVSTMMSQSPGKLPKLSGDPRWHPRWQVSAVNWAILVGLPIIIGFLAPYGEVRAIAILNFLLSLGWLTYNCGLYAALNAKIPKEGTRQWVFWLGVAQMTVAICAISLSWSWDFLKQNFLKFF